MQFSEEPKNKELVLSVMKGPAVLFTLVFVLASTAEGSNSSSLDVGQGQLIASLSGGLEVGRTSSIFIDLRNNASSAPLENSPSDLGAEGLKALGIVAELQSIDEEIEVLSGPQNAGTLGPGENRSLEFAVRANNEAGIGIHPLELVLSYSLLSGAEATGDEDLPDIAFSYRTISQTIPLEVEAALGPRIEVEEVRGSAAPGGESTLEIVFANRGGAPAKDLEAQLMPQEPFSCRSCGVKISAIDQGEKSSAKFSIVTGVTGDAPEGEYALPLSLIYVHNGEERREEMAAIIQVKDQSWTRAAIAPAVVLLLFLLACGIYIAKRGSRRRRPRKRR